MKAAWAIAKREFRAYFGSPLGFIILILFSLVLGFFVYRWSPLGEPDIFARGVADMGGVFAKGHLPLLFVLFGSAISMRLWSEERRLGTDELLLTYPVRSVDAVLGKFLGALGILLLCLLTTLPTLVILFLLVDDPRGVEIPPILGGYFASLVLGATCLAIGQLASSFTRDQLVAFLISFVVLLGWYFFPVLANLLERWPEVASVVRDVGLTSLFDSVDRGVIQYRNILLLLSVCAVALALNAQVLNWRKAG